VLWRATPQKNRDPRADERLFKNGPYDRTLAKVGKRVRPFAEWNVGAASFLRNEEDKRINEKYFLHVVGSK